MEHIKGLSHDVPICPVCQDPYIIKAQVDNGKGDILRCKNTECEAEFYFPINLNYRRMRKDGNGEPVFHELIDRLGPGGRSILNEIPVIGPVSLNPIEKEYLEWLPTADNGIYLITWPSNDVSFLPILVHSHLKERPRDKIAIITKGPIQCPEISARVLPICFLFSRLIEFDEDKLNEPDEAVRKEFDRRFDHRYVLRKQNFVKYIIHRIGGGFDNKFMEYGPHATYKKAKKEIKKMLYEEHAHEREMDLTETELYKRLVRDERITSLDRSGNPSKKKKRFNDNGIYKISIEEGFKWPTKKVKLDKNNILNYILNQTSTSRPFELCKECGKKVPRYRLILNDLAIFSDEDGRLLDDIQDFHPDMLLIPHWDSIFRHIGNSKALSDLWGFIKEKSGEMKALLFSTDQWTRDMYGINESDGWDKRHNITPHTWDCDVVLSNLSKAHYPKRTDSPSPYSFIIKIQEWDLDAISISYMQVEGLDKLLTFIRDVNKRLPNEVGNELKFYLRELTRSILAPWANEGKEFKRFYNGRCLSYDYFRERLKWSDEKLLGDLEEVLSEIYNGDGQTCNPLCEKTIEEISKISGSINGAKTALIFHQHDVRSSTSLLQEKGLTEDIVKVLDWRMLERTLSSQGTDWGHVIITQYIPRTFPLNLLKQVRVHVVGTDDFIHKFKLRIERKLNDLKRRPMHIPHGSEDVPRLLKDIIERSGLKDNEPIDDLFEELSFETSAPSHTSFHSIIGQATYELEPGREAFALLLGGAQGMFIPLGGRIFIVEGGLPRQKDLKKEELEKLARELKGKELLDERDLKRKFAYIFYPGCMDWGGKIVFRKGLDEWNGFEELYSSATVWIMVLIKIRDIIMESEGLEEEEADSFLAKQLATLGLAAKDPEYIRRWWTNLETFTSKDWQEYVIPEIEHPKGSMDLERIFEWIEKDFNGSALVKKEDASRVYKASLLLQEFRRQLLKGEKSKNRAVAELHSLMNPYLHEITSDTAKYIIDNIKIIKINAKTGPYTLMTQAEMNDKIS